MAGEVEGGTPREIVFESPDIVLGHLGMFGFEQVLMKKMVRPDRNVVITGALLWDNENKQQYFVTSAELAALQDRGQQSPSSADSV
jgi:hypothetical protein